MTPDKAFRTVWHRTFLVGSLPEPLERRSFHLQIFDNYIHETRLRLRSIRDPETKVWTRSLQKREAAGIYGGAWNIQEIELSEAEYEHFRQFEGNEIRKNRYFGEIDGRNWEFDVYLGPLWGLNRARVIFASAAEPGNFAPPEFVQAEITEEPFFDDASLVDFDFAEVQERLARISGDEAGTIA